MAATARTITIDPESELGKTLAEADGKPVFVVCDGVRFRVSRAEPDPWSDYDPEKVRDGLRKYAGIISPEDGERIKAMIYQGREEGTRPIDRPRSIPPTSSHQTSTSKSRP